MGDIIEREDSGPQAELEALLGSNSRYLRLIVTIFGSVPWIGGFIAGMSALHGEQEQEKVNVQFRLWIEEHERKLSELNGDVVDIIERLEQLGEDAGERVEQDSYLALVRKGFNTWDRSDTREKRDYIKRLLTNAAGTGLREDDIVRLFIDWIDRYHEVHFAIVRSVYQNRGMTRLDIWESLRADPTLPREDSSDADLFRMLIHDLNTGRIMRQIRYVDPVTGQFMKKSATGPKPKGRSKAKNPYMKSSFDDQDKYELTELGQEFVHYVLTDAVRRLPDS